MNESTRKRKIGYTTPISELQDKFDEIIKATDLKGFQWKTTFETVSQYVNEVYKASEEAIALKKPPEYVTFLSSLIIFWNLYRGIAQLGIHLSEIEKRLVAVESTIAELKIRLK